MGVLMHRDHERKPLGDTERAAGDESPRLKEVGAADFGRSSSCTVL